MKNYIFGAATIFAMSWNAAISGVLPTCHMSASRNQIMDIRQKFFTISPTIQKQDNDIHFRILQTTFIQSVPPSDRCCFVEHIIHFYMDKVFRHYDLLVTEHVKTISQIANSFCELFRSPRACVSSRNRMEFTYTCKDITMLNLGAIETNFKKLPHSKAILKAIGELDILLNWMDSLQ